MLASITRNPNLPHRVAVGSIASSPACTQTDPYDSYLGGGRPDPGPQPLSSEQLEAQQRFAQSPLKSFMLGTATVLLSKLGNLTEKTGQKLHLWKSLGQLHDLPIPPSRLGNLTDFTLDRPICFVPGFQTPKDRFDHLVRKLTEDGRNGGVPYFIQDGKCYADVECRQQVRAPGKDAKVFISVFHSTQDDPEESAPQLDQALKAIRDLTGTDKIDAVGYSMGGLASREYLDHGGDALGKLMMVGCPNQGSELSNFSLYLLDLKRQGHDVDWLLSRKPIGEVDRKALMWLRPVDGNHPNGPLKDLNSRWDQQLAKLEGALSMGSASKRTATPLKHFVHGDGTVPEESLALPGIEVVTTDTKDCGKHSLLLCKPEVYLEMGKFFNWHAEVKGN